MLYTPGKYDENYDQAADNPHNVPIQLAGLCTAQSFSNPLGAPDDLLVYPLKSETLLGNCPKWFQDLSQTRDPVPHQPQG